MRVLLISPYLPYPPYDGGRRRILNMIRGLSIEHEIYLFCFLQSDEQKNSISYLKKFCSQVQVFPRHAAYRIPLHTLYSYLFSWKPWNVVTHSSSNFYKIISKSFAIQDYDAVQVEYNFMMQYIPKYCNVPIILIEHSIESLVIKRLFDNFPRLLRLLFYIEYFKQKNWEINAWKRADKCVAVSRIDQQQISHKIRQEIAVVPNGVDTDLFQFKGIKNREDFSIAFVGNYSYLPNLDGIKYFCQKIFPLIQNEIESVKFYLIGARSNAIIKYICNKDGINIVGEVKNIQSWISHFRIFVCPLRSGSGTRLKILEAMAVGTPVVSTSIGCEGLDVTNMQDILIADSPHSFAESVIQLLINMELWEKIAKNARELVEEKYPWNKSVAGMDEIYKEIINK